MGKNDEAVRSKKKEAASPATEAAGEALEGGVEIKAARLLGYGLPAATLLGTVAMMSVYGVGTGILVLAFGLLLGIVAILWASVRTLSGEAPITLEEAVALGATSTAEEQKRAVLQALKDLEYERSMGKIADADYEDLLQRYRSEAKRLLRAVDEDLAPLRAKAATYLAEQLGTGERPSSGKPEPKLPSGGAKEPNGAAPARCASCSTENDHDAMFCKKCGAKLVEDARA